ncbi:MAG: ATP-binding protein, partial [Firmicutes bacterium]|nr:ATP-binding protein [Bacillota bacterium]
MDKMYGKPIGRVLATEKAPTTIDKFCFWTDCNFRLSAFDVIKVVRSDASITFGVVENISHITDAQSYLTNYVSSDFGNAELVAPTLRVGMNYVNAKVSHNTKGNNTPCHNDDKVYLADESEIIAALGLDKIKNPLVCGQLTMYQNTDNPVTLPVKLDAQFLLGPEGAHLNISGISGLAAKTSYAMFLLKSIQDYNKAKQKATEEESYRVDNKSTAFVIFNVKGKDLLAIDQYNEFAGNNDESETKKAYQDLGLRAEPFGQVKYFVPYTSNGSGRQSTYLTKQEQDQYLYQKKLQKYKYTYEEDRASIEMMFANIDDPLQTMESIISKVIDENDADFSKQTTWNGFLSVVGEKSQKSTDSKAKDEISIMSWRKFKRVISKAIKNDDMFASRAQQENNECRLQESIKQIKSNDVYVIDIAKLSEDKQAFVFGDCL